MAGIVLEKGKTVYAQGQPMTALHLISRGKVQVTYPGGEYLLGKGDVIGISEICSEIHFLGYMTLEETSILTYPLSSMESLDDFLQKHPDVARLFLLSAFHQINTLLSRCSISELNCNNLYQDLTDDYEIYTALCGRYRIPVRTLGDMTGLTAYLSEETPDIWLNSFYLGLQHIYEGSNYKPMAEEPGISLGMLRKCSLDYRKTYMSMDEQFHYQQQISSFYFNENGNDLFDLFTSLYYKLGSDCSDSDQVYGVINRVILQFEGNSCLNNAMVNQRIQSFQNNFSHLGSAESTKEISDVDAPILAELAGSMNTILEFAGLDLELSTDFRQHVNAYKVLEDKSSMADEVCELRRQLTEEFYVLYSILFERSLEAPLVPMPARMFLCFGYVDEELAGIDNSILLYKLASAQTDRSSFGLYTFYDWLLAIFHGKKEPSRNEFDLDYSDYIHKQKISGTITDAELRSLENNAMGKVNYELRNMFPLVNKISYGRVTTFCPLFAAANVLNNLEDSYVTFSKVSKALEIIKKVDYSAFYRESFDYDHMDIMGKETIHLEYLPDIILMPNVGIRGIMWQEIEGKHRNSSGRMVFSIFHMEDLTTSMIRMTGEFRWELCKRIQGSRWNDVSDRSLTSEYFDYIQFYRKNRDLSNEAKEKVRTGLQRAKNSFKEMFVRDYTIWILFEGNGSPRLNKVARRILFTYCPFPAKIINTLMQNPLYTELFDRWQLQSAQKLHRLDSIAKRIQNNNQAIPETLEQEQLFISGNLIS